jgi:tetratricopeptide (TPR) repeat protein
MTAIVVNQKVAEVPLTLQAALALVSDLKQERQWGEIIDRFHPLAEQHPELTQQPGAHELKAEVAFALSQQKRFPEAITLLHECVAEAGENYRYSAAIAFNHYNALMAHQARELDLGDERAHYLEQAHRWLVKARYLYPASVVDYYREGMLFHLLENGKDRQAVPLFQKAASNWEALSDEDRKRRHKDHKNYVKSLYHLGKSLFALRMYDQALESAGRCFSQDQETNHEKPLHKLYLIGKCHFALGRPEEALEALTQAARLPGREPRDYVFELIARCLLRMERFEEALQWIDRIPERFRRAYILRTRGQILYAMRDIHGARECFHQALKRDPLGRHKTFLALGELFFNEGDCESALLQFNKANRFKQERFVSEYDEALYRKGLCLERLGRRSEAAECFSKVLTLNDRHHEAARARRRLAADAAEDEQLV